MSQPEPQLVSKVYTPHQKLTWEEILRRTRSTREVIKKTFDCGDAEADQILISAITATGDDDTLDTLERYVEAASNTQVTLKDLRKSHNIKPHISSDMVTRM